MGNMNLGPQQEQQNLLAGMNDMKFDDKSSEGVWDLSNRCMSNEMLAQWIRQWLLSGNATPRVLRLDHNNIQTSGLIQLLACLPASVEELHLSHNYIDNAGALALSGMADKLRLLDVSSNGLGSEGATALSRALQRESCQLETLKLDNNFIGAAGLDSVLSTLNSNKSLRRLWLHGNPGGHLVSLAGYVRGNTSLLHLTFDSSQNCAELDYILAMNRYGRSCLREMLDAKLWPSVLAVTNHSVRYSILRGRPEVAKWVT